MGRICAVSFQRYGRLYYFDPGAYQPVVGDKVLVPTDDGPEVAECVWAPQEVADDVGGLPVLVGIAGPDHLVRDEANRRVRADARAVVKQLVREEGLPMKVVGIDYLDAQRTFTVFFSSPARVDFRLLVRHVTRALQARVVFRQLQERDAARVQGGIGPCGRDLCCATFLRDFEPVSVRMAREQDLPPNPLKISGACGRLMCCLKYEHPLYQEFHETAPKVGTVVETPAGDGVVVGHNVPSDTVVVRLNDGGRRCACSRASVCGPRKAHEAEYLPETTSSADPATGRLS